MKSATRNGDHLDAAIMPVMASARLMTFTKSSTSLKPAAAACTDFAGGIRWIGNHARLQRSPPSPIRSSVREMAPKKLFRLIKTYRSAISSWERIITKPVLGTVKVANAGRVLIEEIDFTVNFITGEIIFNDQHIPANGARITAGFEFDVPVRFDTDYLEIDLTAFHAGQIPEIPLVEIR